MLGFLFSARNKKDYDVILCVPIGRKLEFLAWETLTKARAIENQSYVFALKSNLRTGNGKTCNYVESNHCFFADGNKFLPKEDHLVMADFRLR